MPSHLYPQSYGDNESYELPVIDADHGQTLKMKDIRHTSRISTRPDVGENDDEDNEVVDEENIRFLERAEQNSRRSSVQSFELYTPEEGKQILEKLDRKVVGFMALLYMLSFLDRSNIGNAKIAGLEHDLHLTSAHYEWLLTAFYITYIAFEWMTLMYRLVQPHIYISLCVLAWGLLASLQSLSQSFTTLLILRSLLGVSEAAFGPGVPFYLSFFYRRSELAFRTGLFISAAPLSASFAGTLGWIITKYGQGGPISAWRLLFLIEGFPSVIAAIIAWGFVPDSPETAEFFDEREKMVAVLRLRDETEDLNNQEFDQLQRKYTLNGQHRRRVRWKEIMQGLLDPKSYLTAMMFFGCNVAFSSMPVFLPTIVRAMGYTSLTAQALSAPPYIVSFLTVLVVAYLSDVHHSRSTYLIVVSLISALGYLLIAVASLLQLSPLYRYIPIYFACAGFFSAITLIITWTLNNQETSVGKGMGMAIMNVIGQCGPLLGTRLYPEIDAPWYVRGMTVCALSMIVVSCLALILRLVLQRENRRRSREYDRKRLVSEALLKKPFLFIL